MKDITTKVKKALSETLNINEIEKVNLHDRLREELGLDSMSSLVFLVKLEETIDGFHIDPDTLNSEDLATVSTIVSYVEKQLNIINS